MLATDGLEMHLEQLLKNDMSEYLNMRDREFETSLIKKLKIHVLMNEIQDMVDLMRERSKESLEGCGDAEIILSFLNWAHMWLQGFKVKKYF